MKNKRISILLCLVGIFLLNQNLFSQNRGLDDKIEAETFNSSLNVELENNNTTVGWFDEGDYMHYSSVDLTNVTSLEMMIAGMNDNGVMELRIGTPGGEVIATYVMQSTGGWTEWRLKNCPLSRTVSGEHDLYLVGKSGYGILNIDSFTLKGSNGGERGINDLIEAEDHQDALNIELENGGTTVGWFDEGDFIKYSSINLNDAGAVEMVVAGENNGGVMELRIDSAAGQVIGTYSMEATGGWTTWLSRKFVLSHNVSGVHDLYLVGKSGNGILNIDSFTLKEHEQADFESYDGYTGVYPGYTLRIDDRFNSFNGEIWTTGDGSFGENYVRFKEENVIFNGDGLMRLRIKKEYVPDSYSWCELDSPGARDYSGGELRTKLKYRYGRIETRLKSPTLSGYIQSLFTFNYPKKPIWDEIDWELQGRHHHGGSTNLIIGKDCSDWSATRNYGAYEEDVNLPSGTIHDWHVYAIEWTPEYIKWFVDGEEVRTLHNWQTEYNNAQYKGWIPGDASPTADGQGQGSEIMMNFWLPNPGIMNNFGGAWSPSAFDGGNYVDAEYDWFRYYSKD